MRFLLNASISPTYANLSRYLKEQNWSATSFEWFSHFSEKNFKFDAAVTETLEFKHLLAQLVEPICPAVMPETFCIDDNNWVSILNSISSQYANQDHVWILKPALLNNGQHIKIFKDHKSIYNHFMNSNRMGGMHVLQRYISPPHLLRGHKYSIRLFVVLTNNGCCFLYPHGYFNVALNPYVENQFMDIRPHLTNEHLAKDEANVVQIPTSKFDFFPEIYKQCKVITSAVLAELNKKIPPQRNLKKSRSLAIFGFDFMVDKDMRVWLLEANHGPCFPVEKEHPLQQYVYFDFWQAFIKKFVDPIAKKIDFSESSVFEPV